MKTDYSFKLVATIIFVGVLIALVGPSHAGNTTVQTPAESAQATNHAE